MITLIKQLPLTIMTSILLQGLTAFNLSACNHLQSFEKENRHPTNIIEKFNSNRVCILIHGCHLHAEEWEKIMFGTQENLGRVPVGIEEAINKHASLIFWGTGGSEKDGIIESDYIFSQTLGPQLNSLAQYVKQNPEELAVYLKSISFLDHRAQNTVEELTFAIEECIANNIQELILVSSPTHIARCLQEACKLKEQDRSLTIKVYARASDTCFAHSMARDVTIFEPPHRGDTPKVPIHQTVKGIFQFIKDPNSAADFNHALTQLIEEHKTHSLHKK